MPVQIDGKAVSVIRTIFSLIFLGLILALAVCAWIARRSRKSIGASVSLLLISLIPPVAGNLIITISKNPVTADVGRYLYFLGMDLIMFALLRFTFAYCRLSWPSKALRNSIYALLAIDAVQLLCNPFFGHAFGSEVVTVGGAPYYKLVPHLGQSFHRLVDYGIFLAVLVIFILKAIHAPRIYEERYTIVLGAMLLGGCWQSYYIFSGAPVDRSMIGFAIFGLLTFYFSLYYRPLRLLDRMLASIASELPEALFFFDPAGRCIWANAPGMALTELREEDFDAATGRLAERFGDIDRAVDEWSDDFVFGSGPQALYYALEKRTVRDEQGRPAGSFLSVRDTTEAQRTLAREKYISTHDQLTGLYTRERLYQRTHEVLTAHPDTDYLAVFVDVNEFKLVNDIFGTAFGDFALQNIARWIARDLSPRSVYGRLAGDTFGVCVPWRSLTPGASSRTSPTSWSPTGRWSTSCSSTWASTP